MLKNSPLSTTLLCSMALVLFATGCATRSTPPLANTSSSGKALKIPSKPTGMGNSTSVPTESMDVPRSKLADDFVNAAKQYMGTPYKWGGTSPSEGFDCSGLIHYTALSSLNVNLPRNTAPLSQEGAQIAVDALAPGDLVFFNTSGHPNSHVGIYTGAGRFMHAPSSGGVVREDSMSNRYWQKNFTQARRIFIDGIAMAANKLNTSNTRPQQAQIISPMPASPALESKEYYLSVLEN